MNLQMKTITLSYLIIALICSVSLGQNNLHRQNEKSGQISATDNNYTGDNLYFGITNDFGEIMPFQYPIGMEHLMVGSYMCGYTISYLSNGSEYTAYSVFEDRYNFEAGSYEELLVTPDEVKVKTVNQTDNGEVSYEQIFTFPTHNKFILIEALITNNSTDTFEDFYYKLFADWDVDNDYEDDYWNYDSTRMMVYGYDEHYCTVSPIFPLPDMIDLEGWDDYNLRETYISMPAGYYENYDGAPIMHYNCGDISPGQTVSISAVFAAADNLVDLQQEVDTAIAMIGSMGSDWSFQMTATGETGTAPNEFSVIIGGDDTANFLPAPPPPPQYLTWLQLWELPAWNGPYGEMIQVWDVSNEYEWTLEIDPNGNVMPPISRTTVLSWDPATLPETPENKGFFIVNDSGNIVVPDMSQQASFEVTGESTVFLHVKYSHMILPFEFNLSQYWNLISLPVMSEDNSLASLFPSATVAYEFVGGTYIQADSLDNGKAYWLYVPNAETVIVEGLPFTEYSVQVDPPWELLGSLSTPSIPTVNPGSIVVIFDFDQTYYPVLDLVMEPGLGYWVNMTADVEEFSLNGDTLIDGSAKFEDAEMFKAAASLDDWELALNLDNDANSFNLHIGCSENMDNIPAPPAPPQYSVWGELYASDWSAGPYFRMIQPSGADISIWVITIDPNGNANPQTSGLAVLSWDVGSIPAQGLLSLVSSDDEILVEDMRVIESLEISGSEVVHYEIVFNTTLGVGSPNNSMPADYILYQNTPNPFNPVTQIKYYLLDSGNVKVTVFNIMGEEVAVLADGVQNPGFHVVNFDAANLTSGVYFYRIEAGDFTDLKKMILIK